MIQTGTFIPLCTDP